MSEKETIRCPRCQVALEKTTKTDIQSDAQTPIELDECPVCGGIWFDKGELPQFDQVAQPVLMELRKIPKDIDQLVGLHCPNCIETPLMKKADHPRDERVIIDYCEQCNGIWLDKGELMAIQKESWWSSMVKLLWKMHF